MLRAGRCVLRSQSLGASHPVYTKRLVALGTLLAILIGAGFAIIPIWVYLTR